MALVGHAGPLPDIKIAMSEGGIGWVAMLLDRLDNIVDRSGYGRDYDARDSARPRSWRGTSGSAPSTTPRPSTPATGSASTTSWSRSTTRTATRRGPTPRRSSKRYWGHLPVEDLRKMTHENAAELFRWPLPPDVLP